MRPTLFALIANANHSQDWDIKEPVNDVLPEIVIVR